MVRKWKIVQRNTHWVNRCTICESINFETGQRRFSATIDGWQNWRLFLFDAGKTPPNVGKIVISKVREILAQIDSGDQEVFEQSGQAW